MGDPYAISRRGFLKSGALAVAATSVACGAPGERWRALSNAEAETLAAACDQIVPPDDFPGASEAGAVEFIDRQLATQESENLGYWQAGLRGLDATAQRRKRRPFHTLAVAEQRALLEDIERGKVMETDWPDTAPGEFFGTLVSYTLLSYYGDPRHGGNRNRASWSMLGLPGPPVRGRHPVVEEPG